MKSPNVNSTSKKRALTSGLKRTLGGRPFALLLAVCPLLLSACQSTDSYKSPANSNNPYAKYEPKTPEEEAYYRDVYSGEWREQTDPAGLGKSICKKSGSVTMPPHWSAMPPGAKTLEEIRAEASAKRTAKALATPYPQQSAAAPAPPKTPYEIAPTQATYAAPVQEQYAPQTQLPQTAYQTETVPAANVVAQNGYPSQGSVAVQPGYNDGMNVQDIASQQTYASQVQQQAVPQQTYAPQVQQQAVSQQTYAPQVQQQAVPQQTYAPQTQQQTAPVQYTPSQYQGAGVERNAVDSLGDKIWIVRGQDPEKKVDSSEKVDVSEKNVVVKADEKAVVTLDESKPGAVVVKPNVFDPSIAAPYANVHRPAANPVAPDNASAKRGEHGEYLVTGGDSKGKVVANEDWLVENLDPEDSVAHFDTTDGKILTEPANRVFLYSPRFGSVRQIIMPVEGSQRFAIDTAVANQGVALDANTVAVQERSQDVKLLAATGSQQIGAAESAMAPTTMNSRVGVIEANGLLRLNEMLTSANVQTVGADEAALLMDGAIAAQSWSDKKGVAVATDRTGPHSNVYLDGPATVFAIEDGTVTSKLRVIKIANKDSAKPGEFVEFTLRFENVGDQTIGNVTILDNLSSRLRYVDGTAKSSVKADFHADLSESGSLVLRWEIIDPMQPKEFGVVRFICKVQ